MSSIFLLQPDDQLLKMTESPYDSEDVLQRLLAIHPDVLAGDQFSGDEPLRWLLIAREAGVPCTDSGNDRWAIDHLFLDQHGIPTLVEVKRSTDSRIRREVIGQMLDYAANAVVYWPAGHIRERFLETCQDDNADWREQVAAFLEIEPSEDGTDRTESFWESVDINLRAGKIRLVFVADEIPRELRRIVEFLNSQMDPAEVFAIEIKQYVGSNVKTLVPKVIGQTARSVPKDGGTRPARSWDRESFLAALKVRVDLETLKTASEILTWIDERLPASSWGSGANDGSRIASFRHDGRRCVAFSIWTYGKIELRFRRLQHDPPFDSFKKRQELAHRLNGIPGITISDQALTFFPSFDIALLDREPELAKFYAAMDWLISEVKSI